MCGIIGYVGAKEASPILFEGLQRMEYRGYDSAGIAVLNGANFQVVKAQGNLSYLREEMKGSIFTGTIGIGHTRWATHGAPSQANAHPHMDSHGRFVVVHNGIIENYRELKRELMEKGHRFLSQTDTEVIPHLLEEYYQGDLIEAAKTIVALLEGSYALAIISKECPHRILSVRQDSPLVVGRGDGETFLASDIPALLPYTRNFYLLENGELALIDAQGIQIMDFHGGPIARSSLQVDWEEEMAKRDGYDHFMLKEIMEQPQAIRNTLRALSGTTQKTGQLKENHLFHYLKDVEKVFITACGTAYYAALIGKHLIEDLAGIPVEVDISSEFRYRKNLLDERSLLICVSQSGETADTLAAVREAKKKGVKTLGIINVVGSSIAREVHTILPLWVGPEISVASTKAYLGMVMAFSLFALEWAKERGSIEEERYQQLLTGLHEIPEKAKRVLEDAPPWIQEMASLIKGASSIFFIGRQLDYLVALEGALKLKEISYIHAECYAAGELKHGALALVEEKTPVVALLTQPHVYAKTLSNIKEVKARGAHVIAIANKRVSHLEEEVDHVYYLEETAPEFSPLLCALPLQMLAYYTALARGCSIDQPRNLAKSVTVE